MKIFISIFLSFYLFGLFAQEDSVKLVKYEDGFLFKDGIYLSFEDFRNNSPSVSFKNIANAKEIYELAEKILVTFCLDQISYLDILNIEGKIKKKEIWGLCIMGQPYIRNFSLLRIYCFSKIIKIGAICHFSVFKYREYYVGYGQYVPREKASQHIIDFEQEGNILDLHYNNIDSILLLKDTQLHSEFKQRKKFKKPKEKNAHAYHYLLKYNQKHPIYFPE